MGNTRSPIPHISTTTPRRQPGAWITVVLLLLISEKAIQHVAVTMAIILDLGGIRGGLALDYRVFLVVGAFEALLFVLGGWGVLQRKTWAWWLLLVLALMDIVGEFVAQGTFMIKINVSIIVAFILLAVSLLYRQTMTHRRDSVAET